MVLVAWVLAMLGGLFVGLVTATAVVQDLDRQRAERHAVPAVLTEDAPRKVPTRAVRDDRVWATVRWKAPDGSTRTNEAKVRPDTPAGTRVTVWTDERGGLTSEPVSHTDAVLQGAAAGVLATAASGGMVWMSAWGVRVCLDRRRMRLWAAEWEQSDLRWGGKTS